MTTIKRGKIPMAQTKKFVRGDLVYCNILGSASEDWEVAVEGSRLLDLQHTIFSWPNVLGVILEARPTLKVAKIYIIALNRCIRTSYDNLFILKEEKHDYNN